MKWGTEIWGGFLLKTKDFAMCRAMLMNYKELQTNFESYPQCADPGSAEQ